MPDYFSIDIIPTTAETKLPIVPHDNFNFSQYCGFLSITLTTLTPVFVGSGDIDMEGSNIYSCFVREVNGFPVIPGSSLKGVIRSIAEALSPSCLGGNECKCSEKREEKEEDKCKLCPACCIFGAAGYLGRISVFDAALQDKGSHPCKMFSVEPSWPAVKVKEGRKFYQPIPQIQEGEERIEVIPPNTVFEGKIRFVNLEDWELGLLLLSMGISPSYRFPVKVGGKKDKGLGTVRIDIVEGKYSIGRELLGDSPKAIDENKIDDMVLEYLVGWGEKHNVNGEIEKNRKRLMSYLKLEEEANGNQRSEKG
ncbi:MAG: RAMP superfamily CRISPR-associated protein [bacterium]|nr:RAMP superfamily CRISPR-associated protein [bacterium]